VKNMTRLHLRPLIAALAFLVFAAPAGAQVGAWSLAGKLDVTMRMGARRAHRSGHFRGIRLTIAADGTYSQPGTLLCGSEEALDEEGNAVVVAEVGTWNRAGGNRLVLRPTNLDELIPLVLDCAGSGLDLELSLDDYHHEVKPARGGRLRGRTVMRGRLYVYDIDRTVRFHAVARYRGTAVAAEAVPLSALRTNLGERGDETPGLPALVITATEQALRR
jgi:hypothetical protein